MTLDARSPTDARALNWRLVVPNEPEGLLLLPAGAETVPGAVVAGEPLFGGVSRRSYPAVAVPDLAVWATPGFPGPRALLASLSGLVAPGGWLCVGFPNRWFPAGGLRNGSLSLRAALRTVRRAGLTDDEVYAALPNQRRAAFLVPLRRREEMDHMLRALFQTSFPEPGRGTIALRSLLDLLRRAALVLPRARRSFMPAYYVVAGRPK